MKRLLIALALLLLLGTAAQAEDGAQELLSGADFTGIQSFSERFDAEIDVENIAESVLRGELPDQDTLLARLRDAALGALRGTAKNLAGAIAPVMLAALIAGVFPEGSGGTGGAQFLMTLALLGTMAEIALPALDSAESCMRAAREFTDAVSPVLAAFAGAAGMNGSAAIITPATALAANIIEIAFSRYGIFACRCALALSAAGSLSGAIDLSPAVTLARKGVNWCCGLVSALFAAMTSLQNSLAAAADSAALRTAKYTVDSLGSLIGSGVSDAWGSYVSGVMIAKSAVGVSGAAALVAAGLNPLIRIISSMLALNLIQLLLKIAGEHRGARAAEQLAGVCQMALALSCGSITVAAILSGAFMLAGRGMLLW